MRRMFARRLALVLALSLAAPSCGGDGHEATYVAPAKGCPRVDDHLDRVYALLQDGRLDHVRQLLEVSLTDDERADLVVTAIRVVSAFEPGTFVALGAMADQVAEADDLQATLGRLLRWIAVDGARAPHAGELGRVRILMNTCELPPVLRLVDALLADEALQRALLELLAGLDLGDALEGVTIDGESGRPAVLALARNVLVAFTSPDFDVAVLMDLLGLVVDVEAEPWPAVTAALEDLLGPGASRDALVGLAHCLLTVDADLSLVGLIFDAATDPELDLLGSLSLPESDVDGGSLLPPTLAAPLHAALRFLADDPPALTSLIAVLTAALRDDVAPGVLADLADVLDAGVLGDVVRLLGALATRECPP